MPVAVTSFACTISGVEYFIGERETLPDDHPAAKAHPELFHQEAPADEPKPAPAPAKRGRRR